MYWETRHFILWNCIMYAGYLYTNILGTKKWGNKYIPQLSPLIDPRNRQYVSFNTHWPIRACYWRLLPISRISYRRLIVYFLDPLQETIACSLDPFTGIIKQLKQLLWSWRRAATKFSAYVYFQPMYND